MADEPRRSHRATKGQHTKNIEEAEEVTSTPTKPKPKGKGKKNKSKNEESEEPDAYVRCICGEYEEEEDNPRDMFCCDNCDAWQHGICMGLPFTQETAPDTYFCEQCKPEDHKELLAAIARGEKPWIEANRRREEEYAAKKKGKKGGRKKGGARPSDIKPEGSETGTPARGTPEGVAPSASSQKRKLEEPQGSSSAEPDIKKARPTPSRVGTQPENGTATSLARRSSSIAAPPGQPLKSELSAGDIASNITDLANPARKQAASALNNLFVAQANAAQKAGSYQVPKGKTVKDIGQKLGLETEHGLYHNLCGGSGDPTDQYKEQLRTILFNVKKNTELRDKILVGSVSGHALSVMNAEDMASKELQQKDAEIKKKAEKQAMIIEESGPRIRKTHKGDELVGDDDQGVAETSLSTSARRRESLIDPDAAARTTSPGPLSPSAMEPQGPISSPTSRRDKPHPIDTQASPRPGAGPERKSSSNFNIQDVWKNVQHSPPQDGSFQPHPPVRQMSGMKHEPLSAIVQPDADIDNLLKDEEMESPPYSPKDFGAADGTVWHGTLCTTSGIEINCAGKFAAGADISARVPLSDFAPSKLVIHGRITPESLNKYICDIKFSSSTDVMIISISPPQNDDHAHASFDKLFSYLVAKDRYGVINKHPTLKHILESYVVPIERGAQRLPDLVNVVANEQVSQMTSERQLLVVFVVKVVGADSTQATPRDPEGTPMTGGGSAFAVGSPIQQQTPFAYTQQHQQSLPSHVTPYGNSTPSHPQQQPTATPFSPPPQHQPHPYQQPPANTQPPPLQGEAAAQHVLGVALTQAPAVQALLKQVPHAGVLEMNVVKEIIDNNPGAENDLEMLKGALMAMPRG